MKNTALTVVALMAWLVAACTQSDGAGQQGSYANISGTIDAIGTRAHDTEWDAGDEIGVSAAGVSTTETNVLYTTSDGDGKFASTSPIVFADGQSVAFTAYYPYAKAGGTVSVSTAAANQTASAQKKIDFLFAKGVGSESNPEVNFVFRHKMSQITLNFTKGNVDALTGLSFKLSGLKHSGTFSTTTGTVTLSSSATATDIEIAPTVASGATAVSQSVILIPQEVSEVELAVSLSGNTYKSTLKLPSSTNNQLLAGYNVKYEMDISKEKLSVSTGTVIGWNEKEGVNSTAYGDITVDDVQILDLAMVDGTFVRIWDAENNKIDEDLWNKFEASRAMEDNACVGIVYWLSTSETNTPLKDDRILAKEHPECTHGYILALKDITVREMSWQFPDESVYENFQNIEGCEVYPTDDGYEPIVINDKDTKQLNKAVGYNNTNVLRLYNSYCSDANHKVYPVLLLDDFAEANEVPKGSSGWYIPSPLELAYIDEAESIVFNDGDYGCTDRLKNINAILGSLRSLGLSTEGINYWLWSSSEYFFTVNMSVYYLAMIVNFGNGHFIGYSAKDEFQNNYARAICAF